MDLNGISIVIATKGRVKLLEELLESVAVARKNFSGPSEVLLIDDSNANDCFVLRWDGSGGIVSALSDVRKG